VDEIEPPPSTHTTFDWIWFKWFQNLYNWIQANIMKDWFIEVAAGAVNGHSSVNKFGRCPDNVDTNLQSDIWDGASQAQATKIWIAPTQARIHQIVSTDAGDDGAPVGVGARTIQIYGLTSWATKETSEVITMNGTTNVPTANSYVIIHRMKVLTKGATNSNVGVISATADTDGTVTAYILAGNGQTLMAVYGIPSIQDAYVYGVWGAVNRKTTGVMDMRLLVNPEPDAELLNFLHKQTVAINSAGNTDMYHPSTPPKKIAGPAIIKLVGFGSANDMDCSAGFDAVIRDN